MSLGARRLHSIKRQPALKVLLTPRFSAVSHVFHNESRLNGVLGHHAQYTWLKQDVNEILSP
jgi:hypothetical protein